MHRSASGRKIPEHRNTDHEPEWKETRRASGEKNPKKDPESAQRPFMPIAVECHECQRHGTRISPLMHETERFGIVWVALESAAEAQDPSPEPEFKSTTCEEENGSSSHRTCAVHRDRRNQYRRGKKVIFQGMTSNRNVPILVSRVLVTLHAVLPIPQARLFYSCNRQKDGRVMLRRPIGWIRGAD
jgi:hypothetical protein